MTSIAVEPYTYVGARDGVVYELNAYGRPAAPAGGSAYNGFALKGLKSYNLTIPPARRIVHVGNDGVRAQQLLPPIEAAAAEINIDGTDLDLLAAIMGVTIVEIAEIQMIPHLSDRRGSEPNVGIMTWQAAVADSGAQRWRTTIVSNTKMIPRLPGLGPDVIDFVFDLAPNPVDQYLWGSELAPLADVSDPYSGVSASQAFSAGIWDGFAAYRPHLVSFKPAAGQTVFPFAENKQAANVTGVQVVTALTTGTPVIQDAADYTMALTGVTFNTAPVTTYGAGVEVNIIYLIED